MNFVFCFRMADRNNGRIKKARGIKSLLSAVLTGIFYRESRTVEYLLGLREIKSVLFQIGSAFGDLPSELHSHHDTYAYIYSKSLLTAMPPKAGGA